MSKPKYQIIAQNLLAKIQNGTYPEGSLIPKEMALTQQFGVSRPTIRQAIQQLVDQGYLEKRRKRGTLVKRTKIAQAFTHVIQSYDQEMAANGLTTKTQVLQFQTEIASADVQAALNIAPQTPVYKLLRLRFANKQPVVLVTSYLPVAPLPQLNQVDFTQRSLYAELAQRGQAITHVRRKLEVLAADETIATLLNVAVQAPLFYFHTQGQTTTGQTLEYSIAKYRGDLNYFVFDIDQSHL